MNTNRQTAGETATLQEETNYIITNGFGTRTLTSEEAEKMFCEPLTLDEYEEHVLTSSSDEDAPAIYVGTYGKYNDGDLSGAWLDLTTFDDRDELIEFCRALHADEHDPELMVQDHMNIPDAFVGSGIAGESIPGDDFFEWLALDEDEREIIADYMKATNRNIKEAMENARDAMFCHVEDWEEMADGMFDECYNIPDGASFYIDYDLWRRDLSYDYHFGDEYVFMAY